MPIIWSNLTIICLLNQSESWTGWPPRKLDRMTSRGSFQPKIALILLSEEIYQIFPCLIQLIFLDVCGIHYLERFSWKRVLFWLFWKLWNGFWDFEYAVFYFGDPDFLTNYSTENFWGEKVLYHERCKREGVKQGSLFSKQWQNFLQNNI